MTPEETWKVADSLFWKWLEHPGRRNNTYDILEMDGYQFNNLRYISYNHSSELESRILESDTRFVDARLGSSQLIYRGSLIVRAKEVWRKPSDLFYDKNPSPENTEVNRDFYMAICMFTNKGRYVYLDWEKNPPNWV